MPFQVNGVSPLYAQVDLPSYSHYEWKNNFVLNNTLVFFFFYDGTYSIKIAIEMFKH